MKQNFLSETKLDDTSNDQNTVSQDIKPLSDKENTEQVTTEIYGSPNYQELIYSQNPNYDV